MKIISKKGLILFFIFISIFINSVSIAYANIENNPIMYQAKTKEKAKYLGWQSAETMISNLISFPKDSKDYYEGNEISITGYLVTQINRNGGTLYLSPKPNSKYDHMLAIKYSSAWGKTLSKYKVGQEISIMHVKVKSVSSSGFQCEIK